MKRIGLIIFAAVVLLCACGQEKTAVTFTITNNASTESEFNKLVLEVPRGESSKNTVFKLITEKDEPLTPGETREFTIEINEEDVNRQGYVSLQVDITSYDMFFDGFSFTEYEITYDEIEGFALVPMPN